jgi:uncharacterized OB-fold protein
MTESFPVPEPDEDDAEWWSFLEQGRLMVAICDSCNARWSRPIPACPYCGSSKVSLVESAGKGTVYSWVTVRRALDPAFATSVPYTVLVVDLDEGARINGRLIDQDAVDEHTRVQFVPFCQAGRNLVGFTRMGPTIKEHNDVAG